MTEFDSTLRSFVTAASSGSPTPGGGSVASVAAALGAALNAMVGRLSQGSRYADHAEQMQVAVVRMEEAIQELEVILSADIQAFERYIQARKLPRETDGQKEMRDQVMQSATVESTEVPLRLARSCRDLLEYSFEMAPYANRNGISDLGVAAILLEAAARSALLTVEFNLLEIRDMTVRNLAHQESDRIRVSVEQRLRQTMEIVRQRFAKGVY